MDLTVVAYVVYLVVSIGLTIWVARTLSRNGRDLPGRRPCTGTRSSPTP